VPLAGVFPPGVVVVTVDPRKPARAGGAPDVGVPAGGEPVVARRADVDRRRRLALDERVDVPPTTDRVPAQGGKRFRRRALSTDPARFWPGHPDLVV
jgi:hypothetical protein